MSGCTKNLWLGIAIGIAFLVVPPTWAEEGDEELLHIVAEENVQQAQALQSIESRIELDGFDYDLQFIRDGVKYRVEYRNKEGSPSQAPPRQTVSFDGETYYQKSGGILGKTTTPPSSKLVPVSTNPFFAPYYWLFAARDDYTWGTACNIEAWHDVLARGTIMGESSIDNIACVRVRLDFPRADTDVWFARDYHHFPIQWECRSKGTDKVRSRVSVEEFRTRNIGSGKMLVPLVARFSQAASQYAMELEYSSAVDESSLRVNESIDPSLFILTASDVQEVIDLDIQPDENHEERVNTADGESAGRVWIAVFGLLAAVVILVGMIVLKRRSA